MIKNKFTKNKDGEYSPQIELFRSLRLYFLYSYHFKLVQENAAIPIDVTLLGILMLVKPVQPENA